MAHQRLTVVFSYDLPMKEILMLVFCYTFSWNLVLIFVLHASTFSQLMVSISYIYSKEAQKLLGMLLLTKFPDNVQKRNEDDNLVIDFSRNIRGMNISIAKEILSSENISSSYISHWKILQGYLESTLQVRHFFCDSSCAWA
jgi:hypothetical protein